MPLYHVRVEYDYWAEADTESDALGWAKDASHDCYLPDHADAELISDTRFAPKDSATLSVLVYGPDGDVTVKESIERNLPNEPDQRRV